MRRNMEDKTIHVGTGSKENRIDRDNQGKQTHGGDDNEQKLVDYRCDTGVLLELGTRGAV